MSNCADEMSPWAAKIMNATALTDNWWEGGNIFSGELPILPFLKLLEEKPPPTDPKAYAQYLEQQMLSTAEEAKCSRISSDRKFTLICVTYQELRRLSNLPNSHRYTFRLCFGFIEKVLLTDVKLKYKDDTNRNTADILHSIIKNLRKDSCTFLPNGNKVLLCFDLARSARRMHAAMDDYPCCGRDCAHREFHDPFKALIKYARREVCYNVCIAVGTRLPLELVELVTEATLALEDVPLSSERDGLEDTENGSFDPSCDLSKDVRSPRMF